MKTLSKSLFVVATILAQVPAFAHTNAKRSTAPAALQPVHEEFGMKLPFDPAYCDLNENGNIEMNEISADNLCFIPGEHHDIFSTKPIATLGLQKGQLLLTIDDGPNPRVTPNILNLLDAYGIKATFFIVGSLIKPNEALIRDMIKRGHTIGNHTFSHDVPNITPKTIVGEVTRAYNALSAAIGGRPAGRLLFRAPGLGWSEPKALNLNNDSVTRNFIGPIHANLGTDAPRADWACWSQGVSAQTCADYYFQDIVNTGRGIVLSHDIYFKAGRGNTYELLKILLDRLHTQAGGIKNRSGQGVWEFVNIQNLSALDKFETNPSPAPVPVPPKRTSDGYIIIDQFSRSDVYVRSEVLAQEGKTTNNSLIPAGARALKTSDVSAVADLGQSLTIGSVTFKKVRIEATRPGFESLKGQIVYIWTAAF